MGQSMSEHDLRRTQNPMKNIVIIGMPGAGKSTMGVILAKTLGRNFIDTDIVAQETTGRLLQEIIDDEGIDAFLETEEKMILDRIPEKINHKKTFMIDR